MKNNHYEHYIRQKSKVDGSPCRKFAEVEQQLEKDSYFDRIDPIAIADETNINSEGMQFAKQHNVEHASFFIVENDGREMDIHSLLQICKRNLESRNQ